MIVVDTNIIAYLYLESERSSQVEQLLKDNTQWVAPILWRSEFRNVLALYLRKRHLSVDQAQAVMREALSLMQGQEYDIVSSRVLELVASSDCSAYDCEFVALAEDLGIPLVTADKRILREFSDIAVSLEGFTGN